MFYLGWNVPSPRQCESENIVKYPEVIFGMEVLQLKDGLLIKTNHAKSAIWQSPQTNLVLNLKIIATQMVNGGSSSTTNNATEQFIFSTLFIEIGSSLL